jgi:deoxyribonuclease-4
LEIPVLVMHPGSHLGLGLSAGIAAFVQNLDRCIDDAAPEGGVNIALENTAGQGTNLGWELSQLRDMIAASNHGARLGICLDTCHAFAAGYELRGPESYQRFIEELDRVVGTDRVKGLHLNDSKTPLGSRRDRHAELGTGHLGLEPFRAIVNDPLWAGLAGCLETPGGPQKWKIELEVLKSMRSVNMPR